MLRAAAHDYQTRLINGEEGKEEEKNKKKMAATKEKTKRTRTRGVIAPVNSVFFFFLVLSKKAGKFVSASGDDVSSLRVEAGRILHVFILFFYIFIFLQVELLQE